MVVVVENGRGSKRSMRKSNSACVVISGSTFPNDSQEKTWAEENFLTIKRRMEGFHLREEEAI